MSVLATYAAVVVVVKKVLLYSAIVVAGVAGLDWAVRTRRLSPFSRTARLMRGRVDPLLAPIERVIVRAGGTPASAPWWALAAVIIGGIVLITLLDFFGNILFQLIVVTQQPREAPMLIASWVFSLLSLALLVRVLSSWFPISPY